MTSEGRLLGLDLGTRRIGIAVTDSARTVATGVQALHRTGDAARDRRAIAALVQDFDAVGVVVGVPYSMSGEVGPAAAAALDEAESLRDVLEVEVVTVDERLTTAAAHGALRATGRSEKARRGVVDQTAAALLLQSWIDREAAQH